MENLAHSPSLHSGENNAPSKPGIKQVGPVRALIADRGYDANHLRHFLAEQQAEAVIPSTASRRKPIPYDTVAYRDRNRIERMVPPQGLATFGH